VTFKRLPRQAGYAGPLCQAHNQNALADAKGEKSVQSIYRERESNRERTRGSADDLEAVTAAVQRTLTERQT